MQLITEPLMSAQAAGFRSFLTALHILGNEDRTGPEIPKVKALLTSRCEIMEGNNLITKAQRELGSLSPCDATKLLRREAGGVPLSKEQAEQLVKLCACNALALTIIAGFLACRRVTPDVRCCAVAYALISASEASGRSLRRDVEGMLRSNASCCLASAQLCYCLHTQCLRLAVALQEAIADACRAGVYAVSEPKAAAGGSLSAGPMAGELGAANVSRYHGHHTVQFASASGVLCTSRLC